MMGDWYDFEGGNEQDEKMQKLIFNCVALRMDPAIEKKAMVYFDDRKHSQIWTKEEVLDNKPIYHYYRIQILEIRGRNHDCKGRKYLFVQNWGAFDTINHRKRSEYLPFAQCLQKFIIQSAERSRNFVFAKIKENDISRSPLPELVQNLIVNYIFEINFLYKMIDEYTFDVKNTIISEFLKVTKKFRIVKSKKNADDSYSKESRRKAVRELLDKEITCQSTDKNDSSSRSFSLMNFYYKQLHTTIEVLDNSTERYKIIEKYFKNSQTSQHRYGKLELKNIFEIERPCDDHRYTNHLTNKRLLWHGTSPFNIASILYEGFRTTRASNGWFGAGTYFANLAAMSLQYCRNAREGVLLLCEVALGDILECDKPCKPLKKNGELPNGKNSVHGVGKFTPNLDDSIEIDGDVLVPYGKIDADKCHNFKGPSIMEYDEFIVYNPAQIKMRYLITFGL